MNQKETDKINAELELISEEEKERIKKVCGEDFTYWDIPAYIRKRNFKGKQKLVNVTEKNQTHQIYVQKNANKEKETVEI